MSDLIERVARAIDEVQLWERINDWTSDCVEGSPVEICRYGRDNEPEIVVVERHSIHERGGVALHAAISRERARAAIAVLDRPVDEGEVERDNSSDLSHIRGDIRLAHSAPKDVPEGWRLAPVEPTEVMLEAGPAQWSNLRDIWSAMLAAAPSLSKDD